MRPLDEPVASLWLTFAQGKPNAGAKGSSANAAEADWLFQVDFEGNVLCDTALQHCSHLLLPDFCWAAARHISAFRSQPIFLTTQDSWHYRVKHQRCVPKESDHRPLTLTLLSQPEVSSPPAPHLPWPHQHHFCCKRPPAPELQHPACHPHRQCFGISKLLDAPCEGGRSKYHPRVHAPMVFYGSRIWKHPRLAPAQAMTWRE